MVVETKRVPDAVFACMPLLYIVLGCSVLLLLALSTLPEPTGFLVVRFTADADCLASFFTTSFSSPKGFSPDSCNAVSAP